jgi:hypothetical protein
MDGGSSRCQSCCTTSMKGYVIFQLSKCLFLLADCLVLFKSVLSLAITPEYYWLFIVCLFVCLFVSGIPATRSVPWHVGNTVFVHDCYLTTCMLQMKNLYIYLLCYMESLFLKCVHPY